MQNSAVENLVTKHKKAPESCIVTQVEVRSSQAQKRRATRDVALTKTRQSPSRYSAGTGSPVEDYSSEQWGVL